MYPSMFDVQSLVGPGLPKGTSILYLQLVLLRSQEVSLRIKSAFVRATKVASTTQRALQHCTKHLLYTHVFGRVRKTVEKIQVLLKSINNNVFFTGNCTLKMRSV
jgi:hypothetical protein